MRRLLFAALGLLSMDVTNPVLAQNPSRPPARNTRRRLQLVESPASNSIVNGEIILAVGVDPIMRPEWAKVAIRIPNQDDVPCESLPFEYRWDTRKAKNGEYLVQVVVVDTRSRAVTVADSVDLWVRNSRSRIARSGPTEERTIPEPTHEGTGSESQPIVITIKGPAPNGTTPVIARPPVGSNRRGSLPALSGIGPASSVPTNRTLTGDDPKESTGSPSPADSPVPSPDEVRATYGRHMWTIRCGVLFHEDQMSQTSDAFLPWNDRGSAPTSVTATAEGARVVTGSGVRTICLTRPPDTKQGYDGFIRVRLCSVSDRGRSDSAQKLASVVSSWQGVPYLWGGSSRSGTDCSGFVMAAYGAMGISLPHGSANLRTYGSNRESTVVHDELHYGDILVYPGHCAIYTGEGTTAETVGGQVGRRTIWIRDHVVVRRFLDSKPERPWERSLFASRGGRRPHKK